MNILVTGSAGFIGFHLTKALLKLGHYVVGVDNMNEYYDKQLKESRLDALVEYAKEYGATDKYQFKRVDISNALEISKVFEEHKFDRIVNLAAQAGVRYSIDNPSAYIDSNLIGFANILEACRKHEIAHLIYASSSSVYGMNSKVPFSTTDRVDHPISLYAATKKANELMAHTYSHLFNIPSTGLRFFTVYGPWGRPDMAYFSFTKKILKNEPIDVFNNGVMQRDFTYIDDIIEGILKIINQIPSPQSSPDTTAKAPYKIYNIGNNQPITLDRFISAIESATGKTSIKNNKPMQAGDVPTTYADISDLMQDFDFKPNTEIEEGINRFFDWYKEYYLLNDK